MSKIFSVSHWSTKTAQHINGHGDRTPRIAIFDSEIDERQPCMLAIAKEFHFSASHILKHLPEGHQCGRLHGHNYVVVVELRAHAEDLGEVGFVRDFGELNVIKHWIDEKLDHQHLNDILDGLNPTAEHIARWIFEHWGERIPELAAVRVSETPRTWAEYRPDRPAGSQAGRGHIHDSD